MICMRRRDFITLLGGAAVTLGPRTARAEQRSMPLVGFLHGYSASGGAQFADTFRKTLSESGFVQGRNVAIEYRWGDARTEHFAALVSELVQRKPDVILVGGSLDLVLAAKAATSTI